MEPPDVVLDNRKNRHPRRRVSGCQGSRATGRDSYPPLWTPYQVRGDGKSTGPFPFISPVYVRADGKALFPKAHYPHYSGIMPLKKSLPLSKNPVPGG